MDFGILLLRVVLGVVIAAHGAQKLFGWFGGPGFAGTSGWLESMGFRPAKAHAAVTGASEFGGGILLVAGFLTPLGAAAIVGTMVAAIVTVHWSSGLFASNGGYEFPLTILAGAAAIAFTGPGAYSIDNAAGWSLAGNGWGAAAVVLGAASALMVAATRRKPAPVAQTEEPALVQPRAA